MASFPNQFAIDLHHTLDKCISWGGYVFMHLQGDSLLHFLVNI